MKPIEQATQTRFEWTKAIGRGQEYHTKISLDEATFLLGLPKVVLEKHLTTIITGTPDRQIAISHGSPRSTALEGLKNWALDNTGKNQQLFASRAYDSLYEITQGAKHEHGQSVVKGKNGLILDTLSQFPSFQGLETLKDFLAGGASLTEVDYEMLSDYLNLLWERMGEDSQKDKGGRRPENVFR